MRTYAGDETQTPDPLIVAKDGDAPAYRGLAYVVFERLPLENFGNRIPQLSFEVVRPIGQLEQMIARGDADPGRDRIRLRAGDRGADARAGPVGAGKPPCHLSPRPTSLAALDDLQAVAPNLERVAIVVAWFGTDLRAGACRVRAGGRQRDQIRRSARTWSVAGRRSRERAAGVDRSTAARPTAARRRTRACAI